MEVAEAEMVSPVEVAEAEMVSPVEVAEEFEIRFLENWGVLLWFLLPLESQKDRSLQP